MCVTDVPGIRKTLVISALPRSLFPSGPPGLSPEILRRHAAAGEALTVSRPTSRTAANADASPARCDWKLTRHRQFVLEYLSEVARSWLSLN
jgi:hypothetical protein